MHTSEMLKKMDQCGGGYKEEERLFKKSLNKFLPVHFLIQVANSCTRRRRVSVELPNMHTCLASSLPCYKWLWEPATGGKKF